MAFTGSAALIALRANTAKDVKSRAGFECWMADGDTSRAQKENGVEFVISVIRYLDLYDNMCVRLKGPGQLISYKMHVRHPDQTFTNLIKFEQKDLVGPEFTMPKWGVYVLPAIRVPLIAIPFSQLEIVIEATAAPIVYLGGIALSPERRQEVCMSPSVLKLATPESTDLKEWFVRDGLINL